MNESSKKKAGYAAAGAGLGVAGTAAVLLRKKKLPRIGTRVSPSEVVKHMPIKLRQATGRVVGMEARLDARLKEFISTEELPYGSGLIGSMDKPCFPSLYLNRSADPGLMKLPGEGSAMVRYKVKRREIDESREDGQPLYGASIEIQSLEPVAEEEEEGEEGETEDLADTMFLKEFGSGGQASMRRTMKSLLKKGDGAGVESLKKRVLRQGDGALERAGKTLGDSPMAMKHKIAMGKFKEGKAWDKINKSYGLESTMFLKEFGSAGLGRLNRVSKSIYKQHSNGVLDIRGTNKALRPVGVKEGVKIESMIQRGAKGGFQHTPDRLTAPIRKKIMAADPVIAARKRAAMFEPKREFAEDRQRDGAGRFAAGSVPGPQDYLLAGAMAKRAKLATAGAGLGALAGGAALARTERGREAFSKLGQSVVRAGGRMVR